MAEHFGDGDGNQGLSGNMLLEAGMDFMSEERRVAMEQKKAVSCLLRPIFTYVKILDFFVIFCVF